MTSGKLRRAKMSLVVLVTKCSRILIWLSVNSFCNIGTSRRNLQLARLSMGVQVTIDNKTYRVILFWHDIRPKRDPFTYPSAAQSAIECDSRVGTRDPFNAPRPGGPS